MPAGAIQSIKPLTESGSLLEVETKPCCVCGATHEFVLNARQFMRWQNGEYIQNAFPDITAGDREILISGTCSECFDTLFPPED